MCPGLITSKEPDWIVFKPIARGSEPAIQDQTPDFLINYGVGRSKLRNSGKE